MRDDEAIFERKVQGPGASICLTTCFLIALAPILGAKMPPIMDFPNHLARIWLIAGGAKQAPLDAIYEIDWAKAGANVGVDVFAAALTQIFSIFLVSKFLVALAFLGPPLGGAILNRTLTGRAHPAQLAFLALVWSTTAIAGFINFQISLGLALAFAAITAKQSDSRAARYGWPALFSTILYFIHPLGSAFYAATTVAVRFGPSFSEPRTRLMQLSVDIFAVVCAVATPVFLSQFFLKPPSRAPWPFWGDAANIVDPLHILTIWLSPILSYKLSVDLAAAAPVAAILGYMLATRRLRVHAGLTLIAALLFTMAPLAPDAIGDGSWLPQRLPIMAALLFLAGLRPGARAEPRRAWLPVALALPIVLRTLWIASVWTGRQTEIAALEGALRDISPGAGVITLQQEALDWRAAPTGRFMIGSPNGVRATGRHLGALAVIERRAFVPTLFSVPGQHPLDVAPARLDLSVPASSIPYPRQLGTSSHGDPYLKDWRTHFEYVLLLNADLPARSDFDPSAQAALALAADTGFARLYRVIPPASVLADEPFE
jgi:hypothetical protein